MIERYAIMTELIITGAVGVGIGAALYFLVSPEPTELLDTMIVLDDSTDMSGSDCYQAGCVTEPGDPCYDTMVKRNNAMAVDHALLVGLGRALPSAASYRYKHDACEIPGFDPFGGALS
jgi:hypothetical protein